MSNILNTSARKTFSGVTKNFGPAIKSGAQTGVAIATTLVVIPLVVTAAGAVGNIIGDAYSRGRKAVAIIREDVTAVARKHKRETSDEVQ